MWPVTPTAGYWRDCVGFNPWVEVIHFNILNEIRAAVGKPVTSVAPETNSVPLPDEAMMLTAGQTMASGESRVLPTEPFNSLIKVMALWLFPLEVKRYGRVTCLERRPRSQPLWRCSLTEIWSYLKIRMFIIWLNGRAAAIKEVKVFIIIAPFPMRAR